MNWRAIFVVLLFPIFCLGSFSEKHTRYMSSGDIISNLNGLFPEVAKSKNFENSCFSFSGEALEWGTSQPSTGEASYKRPAGAFLGSLGECLSIAFDFYSAPQTPAPSLMAYMKRVWPESLIVSKALLRDEDFKMVMTTTASGFSDQEKLDIILTITHIFFDSPD